MSGNKTHWGEDPFTFKGDPQPGKAPSVGRTSVSFSKSDQSDDDDVSKINEPKRQNDRQTSWERQNSVNNGGNGSTVSSDDEDGKQQQQSPRGGRPQPKPRNSSNSNQQPVFNAGEGIRNSGGIPGSYGQRNPSEGYQSGMNKGRNSATSPPRSNLPDFQYNTSGASTVRYESESDSGEESTRYPPSSSHIKKITGSGKVPSGSQFSTNHSGGGRGSTNPPGISKFSANVPGRSQFPNSPPSTPNFSTPKPQPSMITHMNQLKSLGDWSKVGSGGKLHKVLTAYVKNSSSLPATHVEVHSIMERKLKENLGATTQTLLWFKTTTDSARHLEIETRSCIAFYDRLARAFAVKPSEIKEPHRQIILLCSVTLGRVYESEHGYRLWSKTPMQDGYDSVRGNGRLIPNPDENHLESYLIIPCGKTVQAKKGTTRLDYNEYVIYGSGRVSVRYAIDVEIRP